MHRASWIACILLLGLFTPDRRAQAGKPGGTTPPVYYDMHVLGLGQAWDMNQFGTIVGTSSDKTHACLFDLSTGVTDLNLVPDAVLMDLATPLVPPTPIATTDWIAFNANSINNLGQIAGAAENSVSGEFRAFHFDPGHTPPQFTLLEENIHPSAFYPSMNDSGVLCTIDETGDVILHTPIGTGYDRRPLNLSIPVQRVQINNFGVIVASNANTTTSVRLVPDDGYVSEVFFPNCRLDGISDYWACGARAASGKAKSGPIRVGVLDAPSQVQLIYAGNFSNWAGGVNDEGDVVIFGSSVLYKDGVQMKIDDLIAPADRAAWTAYDLRYPVDITNRYAIDPMDPNNPAKRFGVIGFTNVTGSTAEVVLLTPRKP